MATTGTTATTSTIDNLTVNVTAPGLNAGADTVNGGAGDDTIHLERQCCGSDRRPRHRQRRIPKAPCGDTFVINGNASSETYHIYTLPPGMRLPATTSAALADVSRRSSSPAGGTAFANVIAELSEIEEIRINGVDPSRQRHGRRRHVRVIGDFSGTSLRLNTITIDGDAGDDTVDISSLISAHRIVFKSEWRQRHHHRHAAAAGRDRTAGRDRSRTTQSRSTMKRR